MRNKIVVKPIDDLLVGEAWPRKTAKKHREDPSATVTRKLILKEDVKLPEILFVTSYPPRECGIATYSHDLVKALENKFNDSFTIKICALESENEKHSYPTDIKYILNIDAPKAFVELANKINKDKAIHTVMIQHEFGFFEKKEKDFHLLLISITKPIIITFHTVLPSPNESFKVKVQEMAGLVGAIIVMTNSSADILINDYAVPKSKITIIPHGTHLVPHLNKALLKNKYNLTGKKVLSTFGLLSSGKNIETTLNALPAIIKKDPDVMFLIIGKTHPSIVKQEGYKYRNMLDAMVVKLNLQYHVQYINYYLPLAELLEYLQLTDIYLFTSKDPNQAVSGTFSYALSCGCPIISTPIPHAREVLSDNAGIIIDFENAAQLSEGVDRLLKDEDLRKNISSNGLHKMASTAWENSAVAHALLFEKMCDERIALNYNIPEINLDHLKKLTTDLGMIQFSKINQPDPGSGFTLDDNARAMIAMCQYFELTKDESVIQYIQIYFDFIKHCQQPEGYFLNYVNEKKIFTEQNYSSNLADSNGRAVWALGYLSFMSDLLPEEFQVWGNEAEAMIRHTAANISNIHSTRAMSFAIKGLYYSNEKMFSTQKISLIENFADRLVQMYRHESEREWTWFESYLTYGNSILPEAMLCAWLTTGKLIYKEIAKASFDFLLSKTFSGNMLKLISNKSWLHKGEESVVVTKGGEQPIDAAYTIIALNKFYKVFKEENYKQKIDIAFNWFLGNNHLHQVIYNPCTGGCYDGLEENYVNLNQGAESTISYLMARLTIDLDYRKGIKQKIISFPKAAENLKENNFKLKQQYQLV